MSLFHKWRERAGEVTFASNTCCVKIASRSDTREKDVISVNLIDHGSSDTYYNYINNSESIYNVIISRISGTRSTFPLFHTRFVWLFLQLMYLRCVPLYSSRLIRYVIVAGALFQRRGYRRYVEIVTRLLILAEINERALIWNYYYIL